MLACGVIGLPVAQAQPPAAAIAQAGPGLPRTLAAGLPRHLLDALEPGRAAQIRRLIAEPEHACLAAGVPVGGERAQAAIAQAAGALRISPIGAWLLDQAVARGVLICLDHTTPLAAYYRAELRLIGVQAALEASAKAVFLAHELTHVLQHPSYANDRNLPIDDLILMHRMREASAEAIATRVLWQMHRRGRSEAWRAKLQTGYGDIARAFAAALAAAPDGREGAGPELRATRAAFDQWFAWPLRLQQYDSHMLDHVERVAHDRPGPSPPQRRLSDDFLRGLAWHAGETFLLDPAARPLTSAYYRAGLSSENAARLADIAGAFAGRPASDAAALPGKGEALRD